MARRPLQLASLVDRLAVATERVPLVDRRTLAKAAVAGSALATAPLDWALRPKTAYAAVCGCNGQSCECGSQCCDGYTEFCCTTTGRNTCPPGTVVAGWWKVDGSAFCGGPRYYMDCNAGCGPCTTCGGGGTCAGSCTGTRCGCAAGSCGNRKMGCTRFRYGQCNNAIRCVGPIVCRVVTCVAPWKIEPSCTTTPATDENTRNHNRPCLQLPYGALEEVRPAPGGVTVRGWALDPEVTEPVDVHIYVDGVALLAVRADQPRPDIGRSHPGYGPNHGWSATFPLANGPHRICAYAINRGSRSGNALIGCEEVVLDGLPFGHVDAVESSAANDGLRVRGWAIDPDSTAPIEVHLYVDGVGTMVVVADDARPDVAAAYPGFGEAHGFDVVVPAARGRHELCAYAINTPSNPNANRLLACVQAEVGQAPRGDLHAPEVGPKAVRLLGWAFDPDTPMQPLQVQLLVDGQVVATVVADETRPDVAAVFPTAGPDHGFDVVVPVPYGTHEVCAIALNETSGGTNTRIGCRPVRLVAGSPVGVVESVQAGVGSVTVRGWAIDPDTTQPIDVHVYVDGAAVAVRADDPRPDVAERYPSYGQAHGFEVTLRAAAGQRRVCVYGINAQGGDNPPLGCTTVTVS